jgi:chemotaxis protein methyltransferase CheR
MQRELLFIRNYIEKYSGIAINDDNLFIFENRVPEVMKLYKINNFEQLCQMLIENRNIELTDKIINAVTINETFWFRDRTQYSILQDILLPKYIKLLNNGERQKISIWSSACSSGQEPYSIAMFIDNYLLKHDIHNISLDGFEIIATDICDEVLEKGVKASYDSITMERGIDEKFKNRYFTKWGKKWVLNDKIRSAVKFEKVNLKNHNMNRSLFDIIFCKYVLIYFSEQNRREILKGILATMRQDGVLFVGASEIIDYNYFKLYPNEYNNSKYYIF